MRAFLVMLKRELQSYFLSPIGYVTICFFLVVMGISFCLLAAYMAEGARDISVMRALFSESIFFWIALLVVVPVITMRGFAEERRSGTFEVLSTAPVSDLGIVLAKYFGALLFFVCMWLPTLSYIWIMRAFSAEQSPVDTGLIVASYLGVVLLGAAYIALGVLCSSLAKNQITAAIIAFAAIFTSFLIGFAPYLSPDPLLQNIGEYFSSITHMIRFSYGIIDSRPVLLYLSSIVTTLFITVRIVESRRWK